MPPALVRVRELVAKRRGPERSTEAKVTLSSTYLRRVEKDYAEETFYNPQEYRPQTRGECRTIPRPCPYTSCLHHLYLDVNEETGAIKFNFPHLEVWEMSETCSLDVADHGGVTLEAVGAIFNLTRERIRQVEVGGLVKIRTNHRHLLKA